MSLEQQHQHERIPEPYTVRYPWELNFCRTTEAWSLPIFNLPSAETLRNLGLGPVNILAITASGQILDYAATLHLDGMVASVDLIDYNPCQNLFVAYILAQAVIARQNRENLHARVSATPLDFIQKIMANRMLDLFPELAIYPQVFPQVDFPEQVKSFVCNSSPYRKADRQEPKIFTPANFNHYFLHRPDLLQAVVELVKAGKIRFHQGAVEQYRPQKIKRYQVIYLSDITPHLNTIDIEYTNLLLTLDTLLDDAGVAMVSGFGTDCMSIATGDCLRDEDFLAVLKNHPNLQTIVDYPDWNRSVESHIRHRLGFGEDYDEWQMFKYKGPAGLPPKQHLPILIMRSPAARKLFADYVQKYVTI